MDGGKQEIEKGYVPAAIKNIVRSLEDSFIGFHRVNELLNSVRANHNRLLVHDEPGLSNRGIRNVSMDITVGATQKQRRHRVPFSPDQAAPEALRHEPWVH
jgi:hypothetical protein